MSIGSTDLAAGPVQLGCHPPKISSLVTLREFTASGNPWQSVYSNTKPRETSIAIRRFTLSSVAAWPQPLPAIPSVSPLVGLTRHHPSNGAAARLCGGALIVTTTYPLLR